jgi:hypothetical protein
MPRPTDEEWFRREQEWQKRKAAWEQKPQESPPPARQEEEQPPRAEGAGDPEPTEEELKRGRQEAARKIEAAGRQQEEAAFPDYFPRTPQQEYPPGERGDSWEPQQAPPPAPDLVVNPAAPGGGSTNGHAGADDGKAPRVRVRRWASEVPKKVPRWRWQQWLPEGEVSILDGDPGLGKSTVAVDLAARVSQGWAMPPSAGGVPDQGFAPARVILITGEDSPEYTVIHRLEASGANLRNICFHEGYRDRYGEYDFDLGRDLEDLALLIAEIQAGLVVIDPVMAFLGGGVDAHKDQDIRRLLRPLSRLAQSSRAAILILRHLNKLNGGAALYRGGGSIAIIGAARAAWIAGTDPEDETGERHVLAMNKCNLSARPDSLAYRLCHHGVAGLRVEWEPNPVSLTANDILGHGAQRPAGRPAESLREAIEFLQRRLGDGQPVPARELREAALVSQLAWRTVHRAAQAMGVQMVRSGIHTTWQLPCGASGPRAQ